MPTRVFRRTPESERAAVYSYKDLLQDSISLLHQRAAGNVERMTSGEMSDRELEEIALAPAGGMLKVAGTSRLLAGMLAREAQTIAASKKYNPNAPKHILEQTLGRMKGTRGVFKEALKIPEKEYGRIKGIGWDPMRGQALGTKGVYDPSTKKIGLHPQLTDLETIWHEFTHARQWNPEKHSPLLGGGTEAERAWDLRDLTHILKDLAEKTGMSAREFYLQVSPVERHARGVAGAVVKYPRDFDIIFKTALKTEVSSSKQRQIKLLQQLGRGD